MLRWNLLLAGLGWVLIASQVQAQGLGQYTPPQVNSRPTVPPILGINRMNPAINYYTNVRQPQQMNQALQQLQSEYNELQGMQNGLMPTMPGNNDNLPITGHTATFMNTSRYFPQIGTRFANPGMGGAGFGGTNMGRTVTNAPVTTGTRR